jgi:transketolase
VTISLDRIAYEVRRRVLGTIYEAGASHLGTSLSVVDILVGVYASVDLGKIRDQDTDRDRVILSKGHGAAALYCTLEAFSLLPPSEVNLYHLPGSILTGHVNHKVKAVEHSTGALGHGLSVALGMAIALKNRTSSSRVLCVLGDGELQEGSVWEAVMLWQHLGLRNLVLLVDDNQISSITETHRVINMQPLTSRFRGFGLRCVNIDGHRPEDVRMAILETSRHQKPTVILCRTIKGKGVSFAEGDPVWHYRSLSRDQYLSGLNDLERNEEALAEPDF